MTVAISVREHDRIAEATGEQTVADRLHFVRAQVANVADSADAGDVSIEWAATEADVAGTAGRGEIDALRGDQRTVSCPHDQQPKVAVRSVYNRGCCCSMVGSAGRPALSVATTLWAYKLGSSPNSGKGSSDLEKEVNIVPKAVSHALDDFDAVIDALNEVGAQRIAAVSQNAGQVRS